MKKSKILISAVTMFSLCITPMSVEEHTKIVFAKHQNDLNYGNVISPQFPILIILDIIYAYYVEQNKYIREGMHDSTLCALEE